MTRAPKKSETLEIRLPYETKTAFMARCRDEGRTASDALRVFIDGEVEGRPTRSRSRIWIAAAAALGLAIGAAAAPSLAQTTPDHAAFRKLDRNADGALSYEEFSAR
ncbi:MAG: EF-hand domain-containing protein [Brevundimonas sp.]|uniref:EF-hand domain-containing protein n=2 Tax=Alphaproteobacteria TaxID=28211 RepID=UPI0040339DA1